MVSARRREPPDDQQFRVAPRVSAVPGWARAGPALAHPKVAVANLLVHGYNVSHEAFQSGTFPTYAKRLYWAGHPILGAQGAHTIGLSWPGDIPGLPLGTPLYFPEDEFNAFQVGVPLSRFIKEQLAARTLVELSVASNAARRPLRPVGCGWAAPRTGRSRGRA